MRFLQRLVSIAAVATMLLPTVAFADENIRSCCVLVGQSGVSSCFQFLDTAVGSPPTPDSMTAIRQQQRYKCADIPFVYDDRRGNIATYYVNDEENSGICGTALSASCEAQSGAAIPRSTVFTRCLTAANCGTSSNYICEDGFCKVPEGKICAGEDNTTVNCANGLLCRTTPEGKKCLSAEADVNPAGTPTSVTIGENDRPFTPVVPVLGVPIPGFEFTPATEVDGVVSVPYLAQYINAIYRYMTAVVLTVAIVMIVIGGFKYLLAATPLAVKDGKKTITDALIGMLLVLGAYVILNSVNPSLTSLQTLQLAHVDSLEIQYLLRTESSTVDWSEAEASTGTAPVQTSASGINFSAGATNTNTTCPVTLTAPVSSPFRPRDARVEAFMTAMRSRTNGMSTRQKVITSAQAAMSCELHMGSCGNSVKTIYEIAGINNSGVPQRTVGSSGVRFLMGINQDCVTNHAGSRECKTNARAAAARQFSAQNSGWPNAWAADLQPGDHLWIYTAHSGGAGQHATIFLGWAGRGRARVFNGQYAHLVKESTFCITTDCSNMYPITNIWRPE